MPAWRNGRAGESSRCEDELRPYSWAFAGIPLRAASPLQKSRMGSNFYRGSLLAGKSVQFVEDRCGVQRRLCGFCGGLAPWAGRLNLGG